MTVWNTPLHVYAREITEEERNSLSVLAGLVRPGTTVLDLGCGNGALGRHLQAQAGCTVDGVTLNEAEAELARPGFRRIEVADLDRCDLTILFAGQRYDVIICADVLEHLRIPERVLAACRSLLTEDGKLLASIPNAGYAGLVAELLQGEFKYRDEGLLDRTHLRFFTRLSLHRFLDNEDWGIRAFETIERQLPDSEFQLAFDALPPAVANHLLGAPDALVYQFIVTATPGRTGADAPAPTATPAHARFTVNLYLGDADGYTEDRKVRSSGVIGDLRQTVTLRLPADLRITRLRLDPADRPGFLHLHALRLTAADGRIAWQWSSATHGIEVLEATPHSDMLMHGPGLGSSSAMILLAGNDPWIELPAGPAIAQAMGGQLEVELGWPMSADYLALAESLRQFKHEEMSQHLGEISALQSKLQFLQQEHERVQRLLGNEMSALQSRLSEQTSAFAALSTREAGLTKQRSLLVAQKSALVSQRHALQSEVKLLQANLSGLQQHLRWIENSTVFKATRPLVKAKMRMDAILGRTTPPLSTFSPMPLSDSIPELPASPHPVDVIVPVYRGLSDTQRCIESALAALQKTPWRLIIINDCSPDPEVMAWLREAAARDNRITLLENKENLGFVATVNRGMSLSEANDVVLLNSDTEVANNWLDRLVRAAYGNGKVGTITPFSNNATICSYPHFCQANHLPDGNTVAELDAIFSRVNAGYVVDVPTGVGFCMYIRRDCLAEVGLFDVETFGKGYGEENDFCQRAQRAGWRNLHALDTFVHHAGGVSFGASKSQRELDAMAILRRLYPNYESQVHTFIAADPARPYRLAVDLARARVTQLPGVLAVLHDRAGGTLRHAEELAQHLQHCAVFFSLTPSGSQVRLRKLGKGEAFELVFEVPNELEALLQALRQLGIRHLHYHHFIGHQSSIFELPKRLGLTYDFTAHDFYAYCPQISLTGRDNTYCGELGLNQCQDCLRQSPAPGGVDIHTWRASHAPFLSEARHVLAPSRDAARRIAMFVPTADVRLAPHTDLDSTTLLPEPKPQPMDKKGALKIAVIGALSPIKGADVLEDVAVAAAKQGLPIEFHLLGFAYRSLRTQPHARLTVHGQYADADLPQLLAWLQPDLVWFPAQWPETYSYTLSASLQAGLPIVAPNLGAFGERLRHRPWTWIQPWSNTAAQWLVFFVSIREKHFLTGNAPVFISQLNASSDDLEIGHWSYERDYLASIDHSEQPPPLDLAFLSIYGMDRRTGLQATERRTKRRALQLLVRLRSAPGLRRVARAIPLRWQTRIKTWLRA